MSFDRRLYPPHWQAMRQQAFEAAGYRCQVCGVLDCTQVVNPRKPHPLYPDGQPWLVHLQLAHKQQYRTWDAQADTLVLCPSCHRKFDAKYQRKPTRRRFAPVGRVLVWVWYEGRRVLAADAVTFDDVFSVVAALDAETAFEVRPEVLMQGAGSGSYLRTEVGVSVEDEDGACVDFGSLLHEVLQGVVG